MTRKGLIRNIILVSGFVVMVTACSHGRKMAASGYTGVHGAEYQYFYLEALRQANAGHYDAAFDLYRLCLATDSMAPEVYYELGAYYSDLGNDSIAQVYLRKAVELNPKNDFYHERLAQWFIQTGKYDKAIEAYEYLYSLNPNRTDVLEILLQLYQQGKNYDRMLATVERMEEVDGNSEEITLLKMRAYQLKGDKESAYKALKGLADEHPNDVNYKLMLGNWLLKNSRVDEARDIFIQAQKDEPNNEFVAASLYDFYRQQGEDSLQTVYRDRILLNKYTASRTKLTMMQQVIRDNEQHGGDSLEVLEVFRRVMEADPENADLAQLNAAYITLKKMPEPMIEDALIHVLSIEPDNAGARLQLLQYKWEKRHWDEVIMLCEPALEYNPEEMTFCYFQGMAYCQKDDDDNALKAFRQAVGRAGSKSDKSLVSDCYAMMGDLLHQRGQREEAYEAYDSCLHWNPENTGCLNNYAYFLSEEDGDMKKAELMSRKTVVAEPDNGTYLDTYAWILYRQERFMEAKEFIDRAVECCDSTGNNSTIYDHAGDIYVSCDDVEGAVRYWKRALDDGPSDADVIRKKIRKYEK